jgi:hypothetical protein
MQGVEGHVVEWRGHARLRMTPSKNMQAAEVWGMSGSIPSVEKINLYQRSPELATYANIF